MPSNVAAMFSLSVDFANAVDAFESAREKDNERLMLAAVVVEDEVIEKLCHLERVYLADVMEYQTGIATDFTIRLMAAVLGQLQSTRRLHGNLVALRAELLEDRQNTDPDGEAPRGCQAADALREEQARNQRLK